MNRSDYRTEKNGKKKAPDYPNQAQELLSDTSMELSPEKSAFYQKNRAQQTQNNTKSINFDTEEPVLSKGTNRTYTRGYSGVELESDSIYKGKVLGLEPKELSGGEGTSQRHQSTLIDKEIKGKLRKSLVLPRKGVNRNSDVKTSLALSEDRKDLNLFDGDVKYMSSGDYSEFMGKHQPKPSVIRIEDIDEESEEANTLTQKSIGVRYSHQERELRVAFIENLREMVTGVFRDLKQELQDSSEKQLMKIMKDKERVAVLKETVNEDEHLSESTREILKIQDQMMITLGNLLGSQLKQNNKVKGMLIDTLMFLDKQVLEVSKIRRVINQQKKTPRTNESDTESKKLESLKSDDLGLDMENVTDSWVDRHSLLPKEMQATLNQERVKLESPTENPLLTFPSIDNFKKEQPQYMRSMNPLKWMSKIFKTGSEKQKFLNRKRDKMIKKRADKDNNCTSARNYPVKNEIRYNSYSYRFEKKSIFSMPHLGLFAEKYKLKSKNDKNKLRGGYLKNRKTKNFVKKNKEFKDEISGKDEKKRLKEELVKGKKREKIKAVQSMCTSVIQNITDSKILIVKTRSGKEIKNKTCLDEVKQILKGFRKDLQTKQSRMRENNEDILELQSSVRRLESDIKQAQRESGKAVDTRAKEEEIRQKTNQIKSLEDTNKTLSCDMKNLTQQIEELKIQNENNLKEVTKVVKRKFREIESRNKHERQVQKDIILKYNVELESKNTEINELIGRYQELRLLNEDLSKEIDQVKKKKKRSKSNNLGGYNKQYNSKNNLMRRKSRSRLVEEQLMKRTDISQHAILKSVSEFEESLNELDEELQKEEERLEILARAKEKSKKQLYEIEKACKRKSKEVQQNKSRMDLKNQLIQLNLNKSNKARSLETKHRMLKVRRDALGRLINVASKVRSSGNKVINGTTEQLRNILLTREEIKKKEKLVEDQLKKEKYLFRVNELKEEKIKAKNTTIEKMNFKISQLQNQVSESKKFKIIRDKSSVSRKDFHLKRAKKNASTNNLEILNKKKKKLYHNSGKTGSHTNFYNNINSKFMSETLSSLKNTSRKVGKSSTISRRKKKSKTPNREELGEKYAMMIKNNYKNVLNDIKVAKKSFHSKRMSKSGFRATTKKKESQVPRYKFEEVEKELIELRNKYSQLEHKYMETHNDLLRSNNSVKVEALRIKKQSERSLQKNLGSINGSNMGDNDKVIKTMLDKCVGNSFNQMKEFNNSKFILRSMNTSVSNEQTQIPNLNISELHNLAIEEVYATNSSFKNASMGGNSKELVKENKKMKNQIENIKKRLENLLQINIGENVEKMTQKYIEKILIIENKVESLNRKLSQDKLKESLNLLEMNLGDDVMDAEKKGLVTKMKHVKEDLEIEQKNNINLRSQILEKEKRIKELEEELVKANELDKKQVTDKDLIQRNLDLEDKVKDLEKKKADVDVQIGQIRKRYKFSYNKMNEMKAEMEDIEKNMDALSQTVENQRKELKEKDEEIEKIMKEKGRDANAEKSAEDYQKDLATGNKENERLNSLLDEERHKVEELERKILQLNEEVKIAKRGEDELKIKLNLFSQTLKNNEETKHLIDAVVDDPKVTEFGTQGGLKSFSFKHIFKDFQQKLAQAKSISDMDKEEKEFSQDKSLKEKKEKEIIHEPIQIPKNAVVSVVQQPENIDKKIDNKMTFNINNINITHISVISPTSKAQENKNQVSFSPQRTSKSLESNKVPSKKMDFKSKLSTSFDLKSLDDVSNSDKNKPELVISEKKSGFNRMYIPDDMTDSDSSITSLIQKQSPRNSKGDHFIERNKEREVERDISRDGDQQLIKDLETVKKSYNGSSGNMIITKNTRNSVNSVNENFNISPRGKVMHKSLFALKIEGEENETDGVETLAKGNTSFNFKENDQNSIELDKSDSFDDMFLGGKKEMEDGVFSKREINAFEEDELLEKMMEDDEIEAGTTTMEYSQRLIAKTEEGAKKNKNNLNTKPRITVNNAEPKPLTDQQKNLFDESFRNESFAFASNPREQSMLMAPANILNTNQSFAADKLGFISGTSFGTNNEINNLLDSIKEHSKKEEQNVKEHKKPNKNNLMIVPEEGNIAEDFEFELPIQLNQNQKDSNQFNSTNSLAGIGDFLNKHKDRNQKETKLVDIMNGFNTDGLDQNVYDSIFNTKKVAKIDVDGSISPSMQSPSGSTDDMFFGTKVIQEDSDED